MKSHSININTKFIENILIRENKFLNDLFSVVPVPVHETEEVEAGKSFNLKYEMCLIFTL